MALVFVGCSGCFSGLGYGFKFCLWVYAYI